MHLHAGYSILHDDSSPLAIDSFGISEKGETALNHASIPFCLRHRESETIPLRWARRSIPELGHVLQCMGGNHALLSEGVDCAAHQWILRMIPFCQPEKDVAIGQVEGRPGHQS
jgi:hypothetical protein